MTEEKQRKVNEMLDRPIVKDNVLAFMRTGQKSFAPELDEIEKFAHENRVPVIPHETAVFLDFLLGIVAPKNILEIGTAIGFSGGLMVYGHPERKLDTIDRYEKMVIRAKQNFKKLGVNEQVHLLEGDAVDILPALTKKYDFIFMDSAKAKYYDFFSYCMECLEVGGILMIDDVFQGGTVFDPLETIPKRVKKIHKKLNLLLDEISGHPDLETTLLPLGDGILLVRKVNETSFKYMEKNI